MGDLLCRDFYNWYIQPANPFNSSLNYIRRKYNEI